MALSDYLTINQKNDQRIELTEKKIIDLLPYVENYISFFREYPDYLVDLWKGHDNNFELFFYQRFALRMICRYKYTFITCPRAWSKSFVAFLATMIKCVLYPKSKLFAVSGTKEQIASIARDKINELFELLPGLKNEVDLRPGKTTFSKDYVKVTFKNGSTFDIVAAKDSTRGGRRHGGIIEEVILIDGTMMNQVVIPLMNVSRLLPNGETSEPESPLNKSQTYITTSGFRNTFSYDKLLQILLWQILYPEKAMVMGGTWRKILGCAIKKRRTQGKAVFLSK